MIQAISHKTKKNTRITTFITNDNFVGLNLITMTDKPRRNVKGLLSTKRGRQVLYFKLSTESARSLAEQINYQLTKKAIK